MPNGLIALIVVVLALVLVGLFVIVRFGPPKDARRRQVKAARAGQQRAEAALFQVERKLVGLLTDDVVAEDTRTACVGVITEYRQKELEIQRS